MRRRIRPTSPTGVLLAALCLVTATATACSSTSVQGVGSRADAAASSTTQSTPVPSTWVVGGADGSSGAGDKPGGSDGTGDSHDGTGGTADGSNGTGPSIEPGSPAGSPAGEPVSEADSTPPALEFVLQHTSEVDIMYELQPSPFQKEGTHEEVRYLLADARFTLEPAGDGSYRGRGTLEFGPDTWRKHEKKISIGGQSGPDQTCRVRSLDTIIEWTNGTVEVEGLIVNDDGTLSGTMMLGDVHDMWDHVFSVLSGSCGEVQSIDEFQSFLSVLGTGLGGKQVAHAQTDEQYSSWYGVDLTVFSEPVDRDAGDLAALRATFDTYGAVQGSEYTTITIRPAA